MQKEREKIKKYSIIYANLPWRYSAKKVQELMGHARYSTTIDIYTNVTGDKMGTEILKFGKSLYEDNKKIMYVNHCVFKGIFGFCCSTDVSRDAALAMHRTKMNSNHDIYG